MDRNYIIRDYCIMRNGQVVLSGNLIFCNTSQQSPASWLTEVYKHLGINYPKFYKMDSLCKLGFLASELLLHDKSILQYYSGEEVGLILTNAASSLDTDRNHQRSIQDRTAYFPSPSVFVYTLANIVVGEICIRHKFYGESTFFIEEEFNTTRLYTYVKSLLDDRVVRCCLAGWLELNGDHYEAALYLIEKSASDTDGFAIFDPGKLNEFYLQRS